MRKRKLYTIYVAVIVLVGVLYCEILADYIKLAQCHWPTIDAGITSEVNWKPLHALILSDPHLLGPLRGHWLDKLYREWHMHHAFEVAMTLFRPEVVFVLGDLFDEGDLVDGREFAKYVQRFHRVFRTPPTTSIISAVGNHDVGFHYKMHPYFINRFEATFNNTGVQLYTFKEVHFVFINSMAMENDGCGFCTKAELELQTIASSLNCLRHSNCTNERFRAKHGRYSHPILMQHFPTYRISDNVCRVHDAPIIERYREKWEVLSKRSTDMLGKLLHPRVAFSGHSHHYCEFRNRFGVDEYTASSFSWRNKHNPSFLLATFTANKQAVAKCNLPDQDTIYTIYQLIAATTSLLIILQISTYVYKVLLWIFIKIKYV